MYSCLPVKIITVNFLIAVSQPCCGIFPAGTPG